MDWLQLLFPAVGLTLCLMVIGQLALWIVQTYTTTQQNREQFRHWQRTTRAKLDRLTPGVRVPRTSAEGDFPRSWKGWRSFRVADIRQETSDCRSITLVPADGKPLAPYEAGQYLTLQFQWDDCLKPLVRCYSLSTGCHRNIYRITVKQAERDAADESLSVSRFIHQRLQVGDTVNVKAPAGEFKLDTHSHEDLVLLAGGVGITPLFSMIDELTAAKSPRRILLLQGCHHGERHLFRDELAKLAAINPNLYVLNCYSRPRPEDQLNVDYQVHGRISVDLLKQILPHCDYQYYLCGPPEFMESLFRDLLDWGVPEARVHFEAFGPATVKQVARVDAPSHREPTPTSPIPVTFVASGKTAFWDNPQRTLLDIGCENGISLESGCCAGNCGQCAVRLVKGSVFYLDSPGAEIPPGHCLACVACPQSPITIDA